MANRFYDSYRPQHDGQSVIGSSGQKPPSGYTSTDFRSWGGSDPYPKSASNPHAYTPRPSQPDTKGGNFSKSTENPYMDEGGSSVPRKPKTPKKPSSGGMALPIPQKVK